MTLLATLATTVLLIPTPPPPGHWVAPVDGPVVVRRAFRAPPAPWAAGHRGVDLAARPGAPVLAAGAGVVAHASVLAGRGVVSVRHGSLRTTYEPLVVAVRVGQRVRAGATLGLLAPGHGNPQPGECWLHWGLLRGETYLDPMLLLLRRGPSRLLPVWAAGPPASLHPGPPAAPALRATTDRAPTTAELTAQPASPTSGRGTALPVAAGVGATALLAWTLSRAGRRAWPAAAARPSCASGRCGSPSRRAPGRSPPG